jgi:hypothetical protein
MNNTIPRIICSGKNCNKVFSQEWDEYGYSYIILGRLPIDDDDKREQIWFALMKTRIFCSSCCQDYADSIICNNSKIEIK